MRIATAEQVREMDRKAVAEYMLTDRQLMEFAGAVVAKAALEAPALSILIVCGPGNNGGDGMAAARLLHLAGQNVSGLLCGNPEKLRDEALFQYRMAVEAGVQIHSLGEDEYDAVLGTMEEYDVVIDALLGIGARAPLTEEFEDVIRLLNAADPATILSVDVPSGIDCNTGKGLGAYVTATRTVTFGVAKPFLFLNDGPIACGHWTVEDIGYPIELLEDVGMGELIDGDWALATLPVRQRDAHKRSAGTVMIVGGSARYPGAPVLAALGAMRAGAGMVTVATVASAAAAVTARLPECPILPLPEAAGYIAGRAAEIIEEEAKNVDAIIVGPGLGRADCVRAMLDDLFRRVGTKWVIDADALYWLPKLTNKPRGPAVLTPHEGEAARMLDISPEAVKADRFTSADRLAILYDQCVLLKGPYSVIASPDEEIAINPSGGPLLATAGTGDVLAGIIGAFLAMGLPTDDAAIGGAYLHGAAADLLEARHDGSMGALASDIANAIPFARLGALPEIDDDEEFEHSDDYFDEELEEVDN